MKMGNNCGSNCFEYDPCAILALYLLDGEKRIVMKDAPVKFIIKYINDINSTISIEGK